MLLAVMLLPVILSDFIIATGERAVEFGATKVAKVAEIVRMLTTRLVIFTEPRLYGIYISISRRHF
jgi:hypothetical protein